MAAEARKVAEAAKEAAEAAKKAFHGADWSLQLLALHIRRTPALTVQLGESELWTGWSLQLLALHTRRTPALTVNSGSPSFGQAPKGAKVPEPAPCPVD